MAVSEVLHVTARRLWDAAEAGTQFNGDTLDSEGFVHCCTEPQLQHVLQTYFLGATDLVLLRIDPRLLTSQLRWEAGFPHLYGPIDLAAVTAVEPL